MHIILYILVMHIILYILVMHIILYILVMHIILYILVMHIIHILVMQIYSSTVNPLQLHIIWCRFMCTWPLVFVINVFCEYINHVPTVVSYQAF